MKRIIVVILTVALALLIAACGVNDVSPEEENVKIPNPFIDCDTMSAAAELAGFDLTAPDSVGGYSEKLIQAVENDMIQIFYLDGETEQALIRKASGGEDISGDYNSYELDETIQAGGLSVRLRGSGGTVNLATWTDAGYSYSVSVSNGMSESEIIEVVNAVK